MHKWKFHDCSNDKIEMNGNQMEILDLHPFTDFYESLKSIKVNFCPICGYNFEEEKEND